MYCPAASSWSSFVILLVGPYHTGSNAHEKDMTGAHWPKYFPKKAHLHSVIRQTSFDKIPEPIAALSWFMGSTLTIYGGGSRGSSAVNF
jgi:hypothetical protein